MNFVHTKTDKILLFLSHSTKQNNVYKNALWPAFKITALKLRN